MGALAACARAGPDALKDSAQLALTECTDDVCQGAAGAACSRALGARACCAAPCLPRCDCSLCRLFPCPAPAALATAVAALERADRRRLADAADAYERSGGEEEAQLLFDARAALTRLHALLSLGGGAAAGEEEVYDGLHRLLEARRRHCCCCWGARCCCCRGARSS